MWDASTQWYNIGLELGVEPATLDVIEEDNSSTDKKLRNMLKKWLRNSKKIPTTETISKALQSPTVDYGNLPIAQDVHFLCGDD